MAALGLILGLIALTATAHAKLLVPQTRADNPILTLDPLLTGGFEVSLSSDDQRQVLARIGRTFFSTYTSTSIESGLTVTIGNANLTIKEVEDNGAMGIQVRWNVLGHSRLEDCIDFGTHQWYAGPMQVNQIYPIQKAPHPYSAYVSTEAIENQAIAERYWLNSAGQYIYVHPDVPLFVDYNNLLANYLCFGAQIDRPYSTRREHTSLSYDIWFLPDAKAAHKHAVENYLGKPSDVPDFRMVEHPIWSTWAQFGRHINESNLVEFAQEIKLNGFNNSQFEIDDDWEVCYGSLEVDETKFANFAKFVQDIKDLGYRVTLWLHPFINNDCDPWYSEALSKGYFAVDEAGDPDMTWWNSNGTVTGYIDFTNPEAAEWWYQRVKALTDKYGIDSFKFDGGESSFAPEVTVQTGDIDLQPHHIVDTYVRTCARLGNMIEVRAGFRTQDLPIFVRMVDRDSIWGLNNGLATIITATLQMNLNGYTLVLPDMIGGNGYNLETDRADLPTKELFIRWVQANTFLPVMQFSFAPWNFDDETVLISRKYTDLHAEYSQQIWAAIKASVDEGKPVNGPLWWIAPNDQDALLIWDQYLLGENIIVAPVLVEGATSRDIYLPAGVWLEEGDPSRVQVGPVWLKAYPAPLDVLPFFVGDAPTTPSGAGAVTVPFALFFVTFLVNMML